MAIYAGQIIRAIDLSPSEWQPLPLEGNWRNYGNGWSDAQFRSRPLTDTVEVKGTIQWTPESPSNEQLMFVLPTGYRPVSNVAVATGHVSTPVENPVEVRFYNDGRVTVIDAEKLTKHVVTIDGVEIYVGE